MSRRGYAEVRDSGVAWLGEVPAHWEVQRLMNCLHSMESGSREQNEVKLSDGIPSLGGEHIGTEGEILLKNMRYVSQSFFENLRKGVVKENDILLVKDGATIGKVVFVRALPFAQCAVNEHVFIMRSAHNYLPEFLYQNIRSKGVQEGIWQQVTGAAQPGLNSSFIKRISLCCPPLSEQSAIVAFLYREGTRIDALVEKKKQQIALLKEKRIALISHAVTKGLNPNAAMKDSGVAWLGEIPQHWEMIQLGRIGRFSKGGGGNKEDASDAGVPCVRYGDLYTQHEFSIKKIHAFVSEEDAAKYAPIKFGDVLFAGSGETIEEIGKSAVNLMAERAYCGGDVILLRPSVKVDAGFLGYATSCLQANHQKSCMGRGITVMHIYARQLKHLLVVLPPLAEQTAIAGHINREIAQIDALIEKIEQSVDLLREHRVALISAAVTGKVDVR